MRHPLRLIVAGVLATLLMATAAMPADRAAITTKVRAELARLLKKEAATLPTDKPVVELGADDLTVSDHELAVAGLLFVLETDETPSGAASI